MRSLKFDQIRVRVSIGYLLMFISLNCAAQQKITLTQAIDSALQNNLQVKQAQFNQALSGEDLVQSKAALLPSVNANLAAYKLYGNNIDLTTNEFVSSSVNLAQGNLFADVTLFQGLQKLNKIKQNKYYFEADKNNTQKVRNDLTLNVLSTYLRVLSNRDLLKAAKQQLALAQKQLDREQKFFKVGQKTLADLSQAKAQVANAESNVTNSQNEMERSYLLLAQLMERSPGNAFGVVDPGVNEINDLNNEYTAAEVYAKASQSFPDIQLVVNQRLAAERGVAVAKGLMLPKLSLAGSLNTSYSGARRDANTSQIVGNQTVGFVAGSNVPIYAPLYAYRNVSFGDQIDRNFTQAVGLVLSVPILNGFTSRTGLRKAKLEYQNAQVTEELVKRNINKVITEAVWDVQATQKRFRSAVTNFRSTEDAYKVVSQRYTVGLVNSLDVSLSATNRNLAEFAMIQAKYDLIFKSKLIDYYLGNELKF
jgi:outer membrane protein